MTVDGRTLTWADIHQLRPLAVISENLALEYWKTPGEAVGHRIRSLADEPRQEIVGVVGNVRADGLNHPSPAGIAVGLGAAMLTTPLMSALLYGVGPVPKAVFNVVSIDGLLVTMDVHTPP